VPQIHTTRRRDTVASVLRDQAVRHGNRAFLLFERQPGSVEEYTWADMLARAERTAGALHRLGVNPRDRFSVHLSNCPEFFDVWFGAALLGAAMVPSNPLCTVDELAYHYSHAGCRVSVTQPDLLETARAAAGGSITVVSIDEDWVRADDVPPSVDVQPLDVLGVLYTSGTTSRPKGVLITQAAYLSVGDAVAEHIRLQPSDRNLIVLPMFHANAQYYSTMSALVTGASVALAPRFSASRWSEQAATMGATITSLFAAPMRMILAQEPTGHDRAHSLRLGLFAQNVTDEQLATFESRFDVPMAQLYGMTETVAPPTVNPVYGDRRGASIGRPISGARLRVVDADGNDVPLGEEGELLVAGEPGRTLMLAYLDNEEATAQALRDGWLWTGDSVRLDEDGYLYFVDRRKDMIKRAGENVATGEVERVVNDHPAVFESAAYGVPDEMRDEAIHVAIVLHPGTELSADELLAHCRAQLAKFKVPDEVHFVESLPRTSVGKIQKHLLRQQAVADSHQ
jgi:crotonobetaine/carnitine-CoA ligase